MSITVEGARKAFTRRNDPGTTALDGIDFYAADGEFLVIVGPSGSGKTTLLRCLAGLETLDSGRVLIGDRDVTGTPPAERDVAMVFQESTLFPHMSVGENISFGLRARRVDASTTASKVQSVAELMGLDGVLERRPSELSGGERQRAALARAIVREPKVFLMDEPLSDLDAELRAFMRAEIHALQRKLGTTTVFVTHDQIEAMTLGDRVAVLRSGRVEQIATPAELYDRPGNTFVARFIGTPPMNVIPGQSFGAADGFVGIRPERIDLVAGDGARARGRVVHIEMTGAESIVHVAVGEQVLLARVARGVAPDLHSDVGLTFSNEDIHLFAPDGTAAT